MSLLLCPVVQCDRQQKVRRRNSGRFALAATPFVAVAVFILVRSPGEAFLSPVSADGGETVDNSFALDDGSGQFGSKLFGAAAQGCTAAVVAALLLSIAEPIWRSVLTEKKTTIKEAYQSVTFGKYAKTVSTNVPQNMIKFPVFEIINMSLSFTPLSGGMRGVASGILFCSIYMPVSYIRFCRRFEQPIKLNGMYTAFPPTVLRDILYGWGRGTFGGLLVKLFQWLGGHGFLPGLTTTFEGRCVVFGSTVFWACIVSSPANIWIGTWTLTSARKSTFRAFFRADSYIPILGISTIMGISLGLGMYITPWAEILFAWSKDNTLHAGIIGAALFVVIVGLCKRCPGN